MTWVARLILERPDEPDVTELMLGGATLFGRTPPAEYCIPIAQMSRRHMWLRVHTDGGVTVEDAYSTSGIFIDDKLVHGVVRITAGQVVKFGGATLRLVETFEATGDDRTV
jgi:pSer/pThr/pTyr-binding forkhead associated (FHA) protein